MAAAAAEIGAQNWNVTGFDFEVPRSSYIYDMGAALLGSIDPTIPSLTVFLPEVGVALSDLSLAARSLRNARP